MVDMVLTEFDEEAFVRDIRAEGLEQGLKRGLHTLVASLKKFVWSPEELYELIIENEDYKDLSFDEVKALW